MYIIIPSDYIMYIVIIVLNLFRFQPHFPNYRRPTTIKVATNLTRRVHFYWSVGDVGARVCLPALGAEGSNTSWAEGCGVAQTGCGVAQIVAHRLAVRQARVRISARHPWGGPLPSGKQWGKQEWCSTSSIYKILYVCSINVKINKKSGSVPPNIIKKEFTFRWEKRG